jgi:hypothetical protein
MMTVYHQDRTAHLHVEALGRILEKVALENNSEKLAMHL